MSERPDDPNLWPEVTIAVGGRLVEYTNTTKYDIDVYQWYDRYTYQYYHGEHLMIKNVTSDDAAVIECYGSNHFKQRAQLIVVGEYSETCL